MTQRIKVLLTFLIFALLPFSILAWASPKQVPPHLKKAFEHEQSRGVDMAQKSLTLFNEFTQRFAKRTLTETQQALAFDIFYSYWYPVALLDRFKIPPRPVTLWLRTKPGDGTTELLQLWLDFLGSRMSQNNNPSEVSQMLDLSQERDPLLHVKLVPTKKLIVLDHFAGYYRRAALKGKTLADLLTDDYLIEAEPTQRLVMVDDDYLFDELSPEERKRVAFIADGKAMYKIFCEQWLENHPPQDPKANN
ncbi:MAG: hypothetical protein AB7N80_04290 [Bdellovibrionales bacterium]